MKAGLQLRTTTSLTLSPQLQQAIHLLQLSNLELQQELQQMLAENPFLEQIEDDVPDSPDDGATEWPDHNAESPNEESPSEPDTFTLLSDEAGGGLATVHAHEDDWSSTADKNAPLDSDRQNDETSSTEVSDLTLADPWGDASPQSSAAQNDMAYADSSPETLYDHLHRQALALRLNEADQAALYCLIESLDEDGYLEDSLAEVAQSLLAQQQPEHAENAEEQLSEVLHHLTVALRLLHTFDPPGVGARSLGECLCLQLQALPITDDQTTALLAREVALELCQQPLEYLARRDLRQLQKLTPFSAEQIRSAMQLIATLEPKPGRRFAQTEHNIIVPDVLASAQTLSGEKAPAWQVTINPAVLPKVQVHALYAKAMQQHQSETSGPLNQHLQEARWLVRSLQQRFDTILRVAQAIVARQEGFFREGPQAMQPLALREIAEALGLHESTISRVTNGKFMTTPWGTFELKYFFSTALEGKDGETTSSTAVRALLQQLIEAESPARPLSDSRLSELLQEQGIQCARRTVAKYREALRIPPAHLRRTLHEG